MSYQDVMNTILPPQQGRAPHITGHYGERRDNGPHGGSDFNYVGGQAGANLEHPTVHSPVAGTVEFVGGRYGTITIRDAEGNAHQLLHTNTQSVEAGQRVQAGTPIGTMGGRGPLGDSQYAQHVHYQMKDAQGRSIDPEAFWNHRSVGGRSAEAPMADGSLRQGERGAEVRALQERLDQLGYRDQAGRRLGADGDFGARTEEALRAFQREQSLREDGVAGPRTLEALSKAQPRQAPTTLLSDPAHPDYRMYRQAVQGLETLGPGAFPDRPSLERAAGTLAYEARLGGLHTIEHVVASTNGQGLFAVQGGLTDPAHLRVVTDKAQAMSQSLEQSSLKLQQDAPALAQAAQEQTQEQQRQQQSPRMVLG